MVDLIDIVDIVVTILCSIIIIVVVVMPAKEYVQKTLDSVPEIKRDKIKHTPKYKTEQDEWERYNELRKRNENS